MIQLSSIQFYDTSSVYCTVCTIQSQIFFHHHIFDPLDSLLPPKPLFPLLSTTLWPETVSFCLFFLFVAFRVTLHSFLFIYLFIYFLFILREREKEEEREGNLYVQEICQSVASCTPPPSGDLACNPGTCPDWEWNPQPFGARSNQLSHQARAGILEWYFKK